MKQTIIGVNAIFREFIVKDWIITNNKYDQFKEHNKIIVKDILYYAEQNNTSKRII